MSIFRNLKRKQLRSSNFQMNNTNLLTCKIGELVPFFWEETVPKDIWKVRSEMLVKFAPMIAPIMSEVDVYTWYFYVPYRLVWDGAEDFFTGGRLGTSTVTKPTFTISRDNMSGYSSLFSGGSLFDYLGGNEFQTNPSTSDQSLVIDALPFRTYLQIYNDYFADLNIEPELTISKTSGNQDFGTSVLNYFTIRKKKFAKDYFTSALPWAQRGGDVTVPLSGQLDVLVRDDINSKQRYIGNTGDDYPLFNTDVKTDGHGELNGLVDPNGTLYTDFQNADGEGNNSGVGLNIEDLRYSNALQRWLENNAKYGSRYIEQLLARFGVVSSDARLQRAQLVGGGKQSVLVSEIMQTSQSTDTSPQGNRSGDANSYGQHKFFKKLFTEERGILMGLMCVVPKSLYFQGIPKKLQRISRFEHYYPEFQTLGEQPIKRSELFFSGNPDVDNGTFGYTPRYADYKFRQNEVHGDFKGNMSFFHMGRKFASSPVLNKNFLEITSSDFSDVFAVTEDDTAKVWVHIYNHVKARRPMMYNPNPSL